MDNWLIIQYRLVCVITEGVTQEDSTSLVMVQVQAFRLVDRENRSL